MALNPGSALVRLLVARGALDAAAVVNGEVAVRDLSSRNRNMLVSRRSGPSLFVKGGPHTQAEADWCRRLAAVPGLGAPVSRMLETNEAADLLLLESDAGMVNLWTYHLAVERFPVEVGRAVGDALGTLHRHVPPPSGTERGDPVPTALAIHRPPVAALRELTDASLKLIRLVQGHRTMEGHLERLRRTWRPSAAIHNDVKWPNILVAPSDDDAPSEVLLVDWEQAGRGDPAWDIGSALAAYLTFWISSVSPPPGARGATELAASARFPLAAMRPAIAACWEAFVAAGHTGPRTVNGARSRATQMCAARLFQTAFEATEASRSLGAHVSLLVQVAANILDEPEAAADQLLGLGVEQSDARPA